MVRTLETRIQEQAIRKFSYQGPALGERVEKLLAKGVGLTTVAVLLAETNGFATCEKQGQLVSYSVLLLITKRLAPVVPIQRQPQLISHAVKFNRGVL